MNTEFVRDTAMGAVILGFFASAWFGWAQEKPPESWKLALTTGSVVSLAIAIFGGYLAWQNWAARSALHESGSMTRFIGTFWIEIALIAIGGGLLAWQGNAKWIACWTALVVGIHFLPMGPIFKDPGYYVLGALTIAMAISAYIIARKSSITPSAITGAGVGTVLALYAAWNILQTLWRASSPMNLQ